uniref:Amino acid transporter transmembrane domain-containing protein n=1 Tax=Coccolithus braarudii TaxID=221442 RepID=A0A7S0LSH9_9EUKA|mmetsp:Transcript_83/g.205  ORF Transcript_83/g.205 Transcript_83/m.205 type:complete len:472 (+) Transcript_83:39-1454(+)
MRTNADRPQPMIASWDVPASGPIAERLLPVSNSEEGIDNHGSVLQLVALADLKYRVALDEKVHRSSWQQTTLVVTAEVMGAGVLALPYAFSKLGWLLGVLSCTLFAATAIYAGVLLARVRNFMYPAAVSYADLAMQIVGPRFSAFTKACCLSTWGLLLPYYLITANNALAGALGPALHICGWQRALLVVALLTVPLQMRDLHLISYAATLSTLSTFAVVGTASIALVIQAKGKPTIYSTPLLPDQSMTFLDLYGQFARIIFAYQGQSIFCEIMREMRDSRDFPRAVLIGNTLMMGVYLVFVVICNATDGTRVAPFIPDSLDGITKVAVNAFIVYITTVAYVITGQPLHRAIHKALSPSTVDARGVAAALPWLAITTSTLLLAYLVANAVPFFSDFQGLLGALTGAPIVFGWPAFFFLRACKLKRVVVPAVDRIVCYIFLLLFLPVFTLFGCVNALMDIANDWASNGPPFSC